MMMETRDRGFEEISHTADWSLRVWAPDLPSLFAQAAEGMYWLMQLRLEDHPRVERSLEVRGPDAESLLVAFLGELLYLGESEGLGFDQFAIHLHDSRLLAQVQGARIHEQQKEIKAVTYHNLVVIESSAGVSTTIVFDV
jgi:SHS2 domain-containing protein